MYLACLPNEEIQQLTNALKECVRLIDAPLFHNVAKGVLVYPEAILQAEPHFSQDEMYTTVCNIKELSDRIPTGKWELKEVCNPDYPGVTSIFRDTNGIGFVWDTGRDVVKSIGFYIVDTD